MAAAPRSGGLLHFLVAVAHGVQPILEVHLRRVVHHVLILIFSNWMPAVERSMSGFSLCRG